MPLLRGSSRHWLVPTLLFIGLGAGIYLFQQDKPPIAPETPAVLAPKTAAPPLTLSNPLPEVAPEGIGTPLNDSHNALSARIESVRAALEKADPEEAINILRQLRQELMAADRTESLNAVLNFLNSGKDTKTGLGFIVGQGGILEESPSLRVFLLDVLGALDPLQGARFGRQIMTRQESADEWALAMRNVAWGDKTSNGYLSVKLTEMLSHPAWRNAPSAGFLEAFDVAVYTKSTQLLPQLGEMAQTDETPLQRAALVALDRLANVQPAQLLSYLNNNPSLLKDRALVRADYYAKADLRDPIQRHYIEAHLSDPNVNLEEKKKIVSQLPVTTGFISENLLTAPPSPDNADQRVQIFLEVGKKWKDANRFPELRSEIENTLQQFQPETFP